MHLLFSLVLIFFRVNTFSEAAQSYSYFNYYCVSDGYVHDALTNTCRDCPAGSYQGVGQSNELFHAWRFIFVPGVGTAHLTNDAWLYGQPVYQGSGSWYFVCASGADGGDGNKWTVFWNGCLPTRNGCNGGWSYSLRDYGTCDNHLLTLAAISGEGNYGCVMCPDGKFSLGRAGSCTDCSTTCPSGQYISTACTRSSDIGCSSCPSCPAGQYRSGCSGSSSGSCVSCGSLVARAYYTSECTWACNAGYYKYPGLGREPAACLTCNECAPGTDQTQDCTASADRICGITCPSLSAGYYYTYRCTSAECTNKPAGSYYTTSGTCDWACLPSNYWDGASCVSCDSCPTGHIKQNCGGTSAGTCTSCYLPANAYFTSGCNYAYCTSCGIGQTSQSCLVCASCTPVVNAYFTTAGTCDFTCNSGYYKHASGTSCVQCTVCGSNSIMTDCRGWVSGVLYPGTCTSCGSPWTNMEFVNSVDCRMQCVAGYTWDYVNNVCKTCSSTCPTNHVKSADCTRWKDTQCSYNLCTTTKYKNSDCTSIALPANAYYYDTACDFRCNAGYYKRAVNCPACANFGNCFGLCDQCDKKEDCPNGMWIQDYLCGTSTYWLGENTQPAYCMPCSYKFNTDFSRDFGFTTKYDVNDPQYYCTGGNQYPCTKRTCTGNTYFVGCGPAGPNPSGDNYAYYDSKCETCQTCLLGTYENSTCTSTKNRVCIVCEEGYYCPTSLKRLRCPSNTISKAGSFNATHCVAIENYYGPPSESASPCPLGSGSKKNATDITQCNIALAGYEFRFINISNSLVKFTVLCVIDYYCNGSSGKFSCPLNTFTNGVRGVINSTGCIAKQGFYGLPGSIPTACPSNTVSPIGSTNIIACVALSGYYGQPGTPASRCPANTYSNKGSTNVSQCISQPGYYGNSLQNKICDPGYYCNGGLYQMICPNNTFTRNTQGSTVITDCVAKSGFYGIAGTVAAACPLNTNNVAGSMDITSCVADSGYYGPAGNLSTLCPTNTTSQPGSVVVTNCTANAGFFGAGLATLCTADYYCTGSNTILACPPITSSLPGSTVLTNCTAKPGYYGPPGFTPTVCPPNTNSQAGAVMLTNCTANQGFYGAPGSIPSLCPPNTTSPNGNVNSSIFSCTCNSGYTCEYLKKLYVTVNINMIVAKFTPYAQQIVISTLADAAIVATDKVAIASGPTPLGTTIQVSYWISGANALYYESTCGAMLDPTITDPTIINLSWQSQESVTVNKI